MPHRICFYVDCFMLSVFLHNMYVLLIIANLLMAYFSYFISSSKTNIGPLKIDKV